MNELLEAAGNIAAVLGVVICLVAGAARLAGNFYVFDFEGNTLFMGGIGLMVFACLVKIHQMAVKLSP